MGPLLPSWIGGRCSLHRARRPLSFSFLPPRASLVDALLGELPVRNDVHAALVHNRHAAEGPEKEGRGKGVVGENSLQQPQSLSSYLHTSATAAASGLFEGSASGRLRTTLTSLANSMALGVRMALV